MKSRRPRSRCTATRRLTRAELSLPNLTPRAPRRPAQSQSTPSQTTISYSVRLAPRGGLYNPLGNYPYNPSPDFIVKAVFEPGFGHYEIFGVLSDFHDRVFPCVPLTGTTAPAGCSSITSAAGAFNDTRQGGGIGANAAGTSLPRRLTSASTSSAETASAATAQAGFRCDRSSRRHARSDTQFPVPRHAAISPDAETGYQPQRGR